MRVRIPTPQSLTAPMPELVSDAERKEIVARLKRQAIHDPAAAAVLLLLPPRPALITPLPGPLC
jgi:hypothetical protein